MNKDNNSIKARIEKRLENKNFYKLTSTHNIIDFCSNDYLGFSKSLELKDRIQQYSKNLSSISYVGATGPRLVSGNSALIESLENFIATYHNGESGLIFNSGYDAQLGIMSSVPQRGDTVFYDAHLNAGLRDGLRLGYCTAYGFKHNDIDDLKRKFSKAKGNVYVVVESVYAMDGTCAPLVDLCNFCLEQGAFLIVDESHASGVFGNGGKGLVVEKNLTSKVFARIISFGKALGCQGAIVIGTSVLRDYLINFCRPFIFSSALPFHSYIAVKAAYDFINEDEQNLTMLHENITFFKQILISEGTKAQSIFKYIDSISPIQCFLINGNEKAVKAAQILNKKGFDIKAILNPAVPIGKERIRIIIHSFNTKDEIIALVKSINELDLT